MPVSETNIAQLSVEWGAVCLATNVCPCLNAEGLCDRCEEFAADHSERDECPVGCLHCNGKGPQPGRVWALPGMQRMCTRCNGKGLFIMEPRQQCTTCNGTGWVTKRDLGALLQSLLDANFTFAIYGPGVLLNDEPSEYNGAEILVEIDELQENGHQSLLKVKEGQSTILNQGLLRAVAQALVAQGAELGVTA